jgi:hypothetical protein
MAVRAMTQRQLDLLRFITGYQETYGGWPRYCDMAKVVGKGHIADALRELERRGYISRRGHTRQRTIEVLRPVPIPRDPAGEPLYFVRVK